MFSNFSGRYPEEGLLGQMVTLFLIFWGASILFSVVAVPPHIPTSDENTHKMGIEGKHLSIIKAI